ncbi:hypothetical protein HK104_000071 [Borealophlyctis nickersoniae]|nr:hypothetical protein HK104_000071 [Borealophlyctis nickersoniae]
MIERFSATGFQTQVGRTGQSNACFTHNCRHKLEALKNAGYPILVMTGDMDYVLLQPSSSVYLAEKLGARLEVFKGGGHALRLQDPEGHNQLLLDHIQSEK